MKVKELKQHIAELERKLRRMKGDYREDNLDIKQLDQQISYLRKTVFDYQRKRSKL